MIGLLVHCYEYLELGAEDLFGHSASLGHNDPPNPLNLNIIIVLHLSLSEYSDSDFVFFVGHWAYWHDCRWCWDFRPRLKFTHPWFCGFRLCFGALHSSFCISCNDN